jgi:uncharacterized protein (TIGR02594 family)
MTFWDQLKQWFSEFWAGLTLPAKELKEIVAPEDKTPLWVQKALKEKGVKEIPGEKKNPRIAEYHKFIGFPGDEDDSWCASFAGWCLGGGTRKPNARSYLQYGLPLTNPNYGCIVIFWRESKDSWKGHVGFFIKENDTHILVLGGNQDNMVCEKWYPKSQLLGYRWPPMDLPLTENMTLSWETQPGRSAWSAEVVSLGSKNLATYELAKDLREFFPSWNKLSDKEKIRAVSELWVALAYYESSWNPKSASVDVGTKENKNSWSVGLYQMSQIDQKNLAIDFGYSYEDLLTAIPNIRLAHAVMIRQIKKYGFIALKNGDKGRYWAVLLHGNKYSKIAEIKNRIKAAAKV